MITGQFWKRSYARVVVIKKAKC